MIELAGLSEPKAESVDEVSEAGEEGKIGARLSVTQSDDPLSGGHFALGVSKPPLEASRVSRRDRRKEEEDVPRARQRT